MGGGGGEEDRYTYNGILPRFSCPSFLIPLVIKTSNRNTVVELRIELKGGFYLNLNEI